MARILAAFSSLLFCITLSACDSGFKTASDSALPLTEPGVRSSVEKAVTQTVSTPYVFQPNQPADASSSTSEPLQTPQNTGVTIKPDENSDRYIIVYPMNDFNNALNAKSKNYTLYVTPGDYSDPDNAVSTFLFDLYKAQCLCYENIHADVESDSENQPFLRTLYLMEYMMLSLGQIDVLALPKMEYYEDGSPYIFRNMPAYKALDEDVIRFGSLVEKDAYRQEVKGTFNGETGTLFYQVDTQKEDAPPSSTYFEAVKTKAGDFLYRCINIYNGKLRSVFVSTASHLMEAGFSEGELKEDFKFQPLKKNTTLEKSDKQNGLTQKLYLFASEDGAVVKPLEETPDKK